MLAVSTPQKLGMVFAVAFVVGWAIFIVAHLKRGGVAPGAEIELAPNRKPYYDDEQLEGLKLERVLTMALILIIILAVGLPLYWLGEPRRQKGAVKYFDKKAVAAGFLLFQPTDTPLPPHPKDNAIPFGCAKCHGNVGQGGSTTYVLTTGGTVRTVTWDVPALNTVLLRYTPDTVRTIITYGRANTPMPPWGVAGGGAMNDQQIDDLVAYLQSIQLTPAQAKDLAAKYGTNGKSLFDAYCARCHTKGYSYGEPTVSGGGAFGPNLTNGVELRQFLAATDQVAFVTAGAEFGKQYGTRGIGEMAPANRVDPETAGAAGAGGGMPYFSQVLTPEQIQAIVDYERGL
ncbi:MAG TPA: c-type cytochrome [Acidimicrobiales bacterium]|nr:c-type cytochrome [Acidimicrobiales bacterium]